MKRKQIIQTDGDCVIVITPNQTVNATGYHYVMTACGVLCESVMCETVEEALQRARVQWLEEFDRFGHYDLESTDPAFDEMINSAVRKFEI